MNRRETVLAMLALSVSSLETLAQQQPKKAPRVGWLVHGTQASQEDLLEEFRGGMRDLGCRAAKDRLLRRRRP